MERENDSLGMGHELGYGGVERLVDQVEKVCAHERQGIELTNEAKILGLQFELSAWADEERSLGERLRLAPPPGDSRFRRHRARFAGAIAFLLTLAGFFFSLLAFDPFRLGWKSYLYCIGIAIVCPYCVERCLEEWDSRRLIKGLVTLACVSAVASLIFLAVIRGDLFSQQIKDSEAPVLVGDDSPSVPQDDNHLYEEALPLLRLVMALLAVAMELGAGLALHDAKRFGAGSEEDFESLSKKLIDVRLRMAMLISHIQELSNEGSIFETRFWRDFYRAMLTHTARKALGKLLALGFLILVMVPHGALADEPRLDLVIAIDLSASVATKGPDGRTDFEKNVVAVTTLLASVPAGSRVTILGITGNSFAQPDILLQAEVAEDKGYFGERLSAARRQLIRAWRDRSTHVAPNSLQTDILGALLVAGQLFKEKPNALRKVLVIYSDMRQATPRLDLERAAKIAVDQELQRIKRNDLLSDLSGVHVYTLGVDAAGRDAIEWESLRRFWAAYFTTTRANLQDYSVLREVPNRWLSRQ